VSEYVFTIEHGGAPVLLDAVVAAPPDPEAEPNPAVEAAKRLPRGRMLGAAMPSLTLRARSKTSARPA
jgi:hypothetical protein